VDDFAIETRAFAEEELDLLLDDFGEQLVFGSGGKDLLGVEVVAFTLSFIVSQ
jgi:hypothetical protein